MAKRYSTTTEDFGWPMERFDLLGGGEVMREDPLVGRAEHLGSSRTQVAKHVSPNISLISQVKT